LLVKAGKLTVIFRGLEKHATFSGFIFERFLFWEFAFLAVKTVT